MRLTLRTMLAYMDDILEPADREEIARKIEDSEFARNLMHRIRESTQKARLGAPKLNAKGLGFDANTVAEYLDNTLSGERVPDFERVCLESDIHLAEVAACHQVLTMVLGRPAEIDPAMKRKMYKIAERMAALPQSPQVQHEAGFQPATSDGAAPPTEEVFVVPPPRHRPEVPAYLRERNARPIWRTVLAAVVLLVLFLGAITMALGPLDHTNPIVGKLFKAPTQETAKKTGQDNQTPSNNTAAEGTSTEPDLSGATNANTIDAKSPDSTTAANSGATAPDGSAASPIIDGAAPKSTLPTEPVAPAPEPRLQQPMSVPPSNPSVPSNSGVASVPLGTPPPPEPMPPTAPSPNAGEAMSNDAAAAPRPADGTVANVPGPAATVNPPAVNPPAANPLAVNPSAANNTGPGDVPPEPMPPAADLPLGRFLAGNGVVLLRLDTATGQWNRMPPNSPLAAGDKLLVLPTFRPTITLSSGLTLQLSSETMIELEGADASGVAGVKLRFGRFVAMTTGQAGSQLRVELGPASNPARGVITFVDADTTLGAEVRLFHPVGIDPEKQQPQVAVDLYDANGAVEWTPTGGAVINIAGMQRLAVVPHPADPSPADKATTIAKMPPWIERDLIPPTLTEPSSKLAEELADEKRPLLQTLREFADHRRIEYRMLAAQCMALLDQYDPVIDGINDDRNKAYWAGLISTARNTLTRGPATATRLREAYEKRRGLTNGAQLYRLLGGYTNDQLTAGAAAELVGYLDNDNLDFRVLAITNLIEITTRNHSYQPEQKNATLRRPAVNRWKQELSAGHIVRKDPAAK